jgi:hypothetical protein
MTYSAKRRSVSAFYLHPSSFKLVEPEVVATSPYPVKSRVPVCCGFDSLKLARRAVARDVKQAKPASLRYVAATFPRSSVAREGWWAREDLHLQGSQTLEFVLWGQRIKLPAGLFHRLTPSAFRKYWAA